MSPVAKRVLPEQHRRRTRPLAPRFRLRDVPSKFVANAKLILLDTLGAMRESPPRGYSTTRIQVDFIRPSVGER